MNLKNLLILLTLLFHSLLSGVYGQKGAVYLQHYGNPIPHLTTQNKAIVQTTWGTMLMANAQGALQYDGHGWQLIDTKATLHVLCPDNDRIYTAGRTSAGYLEKQPAGQLKYINLTAKHKQLPQIKGNFNFIGKTSRYIYFLSKKLLIQFSKKQNKITQFWQSEVKQPFQGLLVFKEQVLVNIAGRGFQQLKKENTQYKLVATTAGAKFKNINVTSTFAGKASLFFTTSDNRVYRYNGNSWKQLKLADQKYLQEHTLTTGQLIANKYLALGTLGGGVLLVNIDNGKTLYVINNQTGLPDDEVLAIGTDHQKGLWIAHPLGISRAALNIPVANFNYYSGLVGNMTAVTRWNNQLYVATTQGLFYLQKTKTYADLIKYVTIEQARAEKNRPIVTKVITEKGGGTVVGNLINKAFGRKKRKIVKYVRPKQVTKTSTKATETLLKKQLYALKSFPYFYQKVKGFEGKINHLLALPDQLLIGSNNGLFTYKNRQVSSLIPGVYINQIKPSKNSLYIATQKGVLSLRKQGSNWALHENFAKIRTPVHSVALIGNELWVGSENQVIKVVLNAKGKYQSQQIFDLPQNYLEKVQLTSIKNKPILFLSDGVYRFNAQKKRFEKDELLKATHLPYQVIQRQKEKSWTNIQHQWVNMQNIDKAPYLALFDRITDIYQEKNNLWVIHDNVLHRIRLAYIRNRRPMKVLINKVANHLNKELPLDKIKLYQGTKAYGLTIDFSVPYYLDETSIEYQYRIKGTYKGWSRWQKTPRITLNFLPQGKHLLEIRARNSLGQGSEIKQLSVKVIPPFWKTWWFYLMEICVLLSLMLAAALSSRFSKYDRYSYILTFVTIITVFEFIVLMFEPSVDDFSGGVPVFKLFMNIILAISLNPIERKLAAWLSKNKHNMHA